jgi:hypothetical protein
VTRGLIDHGAGLLVGAQLRPAATAAFARRALACRLSQILRHHHAIQAMLLDDACHSIDSPNMRSILENIKFPN